MSFTAIIEHDTIKLPPGLHLPDGTRVNVEPLPPGKSTGPRQSFAERYAEFIGIWQDGPTDLAANHDHYALGTPSRMP